MLKMYLVHKPLYIKEEFKTKNKYFKPRMELLGLAFQSAWLTRKLAEHAASTIPGAIIKEAILYDRAFDKVAYEPGASGELPDGED